MKKDNAQNAMNGPSRQGWGKKGKKQQQRPASTRQKLWNFLQSRRLVLEECSVFSSDIFHALRSEIIVSVCSLHKQTIRLKHCNISENLIFLYSWVCPLQQYSLYRGPSVKHNMTLLTEHYYRVIKKCHISKKNSAPAHVSLIFC